MNYKPRTSINRFVCLLLCLTLLSVAITGCSKTKASSESKTETEDTETEESQSSSETSDTVETDRKKRAEYETKVIDEEKLYKENPTDQEIALNYAQTRYTLGDFDEAQEILTPFVNVEKPDPEVLSLSADIAYLNGNYEEAEKLYKVLKNDYPEEYGSAAMYGLQMVYYQTDQYSKVKEEFAGEDLSDSMWDMANVMNEFDDAPYQLNWNGYDQTAIPFLTTDPLPVIPIEVNGVKMNAFIDTGGANLTLSETVATDLGIESIITTEGQGGGGTAEVSFGKTDSLKLGDVEIQNIPVDIAQPELFTSDIGGYHTDAVIGTNVLQHFIPTIDYLSGQLILVPRNESGQEQLQTRLSGENVEEEIPFSLADTHFMFAKGSVNGHEDLNMFVDSGLSDEEEGAGMMLTKDTMSLLDIPMPEMVQESGTDVVGDDGYATGSFDLSYGLGNENIQGVGCYFSTDPVSSFIDGFGFFGDALISHNYLKQYKWTIDFDSRIMTFSK